MKIFIDTGAFIAAADNTDQYHLPAVNFITSSFLKYQPVTSNFVICETLNFLRSRAGYQPAVTFREKLVESGGIDIITVNPLLEEQAWQIFKKYKDKEFSFTDCTSFAIMKALSIDTAFTFDQHFSQFGFVKLP
jgi:hypothetical protein